MGFFLFGQRPLFKEKLMNTSVQSKRSGIVATTAAALALAAIGFAGAAQARDNVTFSVGVGVPGVQVGVTNAYPVYTQAQPVYVQPRPVYVQPRPVYVQPAPVYYRPAPVYVQPAPVYYRPAPVYYAPQPVYYGRPHHGGREWNNGRHGQGHQGGYYAQPQQPVVYGPGGYRPGFGPAGSPAYRQGYAPVQVQYQR